MAHRMEESPPKVSRILFTNTTIANPTGTELYVRDLAKEFAARGCEVVIYTPRPGRLAEDIRAMAIPVVSQLAHLGSPPDIIHGQHHVPTMQALLAFPGTPAVFFCHGWRPWVEMPPAFPRIRRHVAVDPVTRDRIVHESGVALDKVRLIPNFVDLEIFQPRWPLPEWPERAAIFSNYVKPGSPYFRAVAAACSHLGIPLDVVGAGFGTETNRPESVLPNYDLVFAQGRSAIEALAVGAAVIVASSRAFGPLVRPENFAELRRCNFGIRALAYPVDAAHIESEIRKFEPGAAAEVTVRIRGEAGLKAAADAVMQVYQEAIAEHRSDPVDPMAENFAMAGYLGRLDERLQRTGDLERHAANLDRKLDALQEISKERGRVIQRMKRTRLWRFRNWLHGMRREKDPTR